MGDRMLDDKFEKQLRALGYAVLHIEAANTGRGGTGVRITDVRFKLDADNRTSVLAILKGVRGDESLVAFVGAFDLSTCMLSIAEKLRGGTLRWRLDTPWDGGKS